MVSTFVEMCEQNKFGVNADKNKVMVVKSEGDSNFNMKIDGE